MLLLLLLQLELLVGEEVRLLLDGCLLLGATVRRVQRVLAACQEKRTLGCFWRTGRLCQMLGHARRASLAQEELLLLLLLLLLLELELGAQRPIARVADNPMMVLELVLVLMLVGELLLLVLREELCARGGGLVGGGGGGSAAAG